MTQEEKIAKIRAKIRDVPDFPKKGILFKDITPLLADGSLFQDVITLFANRYKDAGITQIVSIESRGFIFGAALSQALGIGFIPVRKPGKLPYESRSITYELEYGTDTLQIHTDAVGASDNVLIMDDLLATGGTAKAAYDLVSGLGANVFECAFMIELAFLAGRERLLPSKIFSLLQY